ncbi:LacI family DNA-binding transcriptional regulator [Acidisoma sp. S159]|uniref:LacI family DNA-binding transcriptional regulator n=1 Tax=Acidisoma sp. S159 TaxID=1747225 RepID=UPI00131CAF0C|nr:LacI family DNA-binding transcriptional regulator [Acidisoma sp. S159]
MAQDDEGEVRRKPRFQDIAREAGVGTATVERVLNGRSNVSPRMAHRVIVAARSLGYDRSLPSLYRARIRIEVVLIRPETEFFSRLSKEFEKIAASADKSIIIHRSFLQEDAPYTIARRIEKAAQDRSGLIVVVQDHPAIIAALAAADTKGIPIVLLVSDVQYGGAGVYVGIDNESAGRTAGYFMTRMLGGRHGRVVALCHSGAYLVHRQRLLGFSRYFPADSDRLTFAACLMTRDTDDLSYALVRQALQEHDDLVGVYHTGGGHLGVDRALNEFGRSGQVVYIGHELSPATRLFLASGTIALTIDQAPELQVRRALEVLETLIGLRKGPPDKSPIPFRVITRENIGL